MIIGIGTDMLEVYRIQNILDRRDPMKFLARILTPAEITLAQVRTKNVVTFVAGRFAAKEAIVKAMGYGIGSCVGFQDIEILPDQWGKPCVQLSQASRLRCKLDEHTIVHLSITHTHRHASAFAVLEQR